MDGDGVKGGGGVGQTAVWTRVSVREGAGPAIPRVPGPKWALCVCVCVQGVSSSLASGRGKGPCRMRNKMTHCRGHSRTAPPGTCRSRGRGPERRRSQRPPHTGCGCYTCGEEMGRLGKDEPGTGQGRPRVRRGMDISTLGRNHGDHAKGLMWVLFSVSCLLSPSR